MKCHILNNALECSFLINLVTDYQKGLWPSKLVQTVVILTYTPGLSSSSLRQDTKYSM